MAKTSTFNRLRGLGPDGKPTRPAPKMKPKKIAREAEVEEPPKRKRRKRSDD